MNTASRPGEVGPPWPASIDFSKLEDGGLEVATGGDPLTLDFNSRLFRVVVGDGTLALGEFVYVRGSFAFEQDQKITLDDADGVSRTVRGITVGAANAYVFAGVGGPYWTDSDGDGKITER